MAPNSYSEKRNSSEEMHTEAMIPKQQMKELRHSDNLVKHEFFFFKKVSQDFKSLGD